MVKASTSGRTPAAARRAAEAQAPTRSRRPTKRDVLVDLGDRSLPLYKSIKLQLMRRLSAGGIKTGMALPTEKQLCERYGVSVGTVRRALSELVAEKILVRQQGRGTFLAPYDSARMLNSFWHIKRKDGTREPPIVQTLRFQETEADAVTAAHLGIRTRDPVYSIVNLMLMGGKPMLVDGLHIPRTLFADLTEAAFLARNGTIYDLYRDGFGVNVVRTVDHLGSVPADRDTAKLLGLALGTPLLEIVRVAHTFGDTPVEFRRSLLYTEDYEFVDVTGGGAPT